MLSLESTATANWPTLSWKVIENSSILNQKLMTKKRQNFSAIYTCPSFRIWEVVGYLSKEEVNFTLQNLTICVPWPDQMLYFLRLGITNLSLEAWFQLSLKYFETIKTMIYKHYSDYHVRLTQSNSTLFNGANVIDPIVWSMRYSGCLEFFFFWH